jgi:hypothetical protein
MQLARRLLIICGPTLIFCSKLHETKVLRHNTLTKLKFPRSERRVYPSNKVASVVDRDSSVGITTG